LLSVCAAAVFANDHWGGWGKFGYDVKVHHPSIHGWHVGPSHGWTSFYDTRDKNPKGWGWGHEKKHEHKQHKGWGWGH
jgi:hypothetical protein